MENTFSSSREDKWHSAPNVGFSEPLLQMVAQQAGVLPAFTISQFSLTDDHMLEQPADMEMSSFSDMCSDPQMLLSEHLLVVAKKMMSSDKLLSNVKRNIFF